MDKLFDSVWEDAMMGVEQSIISEEEMIARMRARDAAEAEQKAVRIRREEAKQAAIAATYVRKVDSTGRSYARGRRKSSVARVYVKPGKGDVVVNKLSLDAYFHRVTDRLKVLKPLLVTDTIDKFSVSANTAGGGLTGQTGAMSLGIARALLRQDPSFRPVLRAHGLLTRDSREVERKKPGKPKARKSFQWVKR